MKYLLLFLLVFSATAFSRVTVNGSPCIPISEAWGNVKYVITNCVAHHLYKNGKLPKDIELIVKKIRNEMNIPDSIYKSEILNKINYIKNQKSRTKDFAEPLLQMSEESRLEDCETLRMYEHIK